MQHCNAWCICSIDLCKCKTTIKVMVKWQRQTTWATMRYRNWQEENSEWNLIRRQLCLVFKNLNTVKKCCFFEEDNENPFDANFATLTCWLSQIPDIYDDVSNYMPTWILLHFCNERVYAPVTSFSNQEPITP